MRRMRARILTRLCRLVPRDLHEVILGSKKMGPPPLARGLRNFIDEIKLCKSRDEEAHRVKEECVYPLPFCGLKPEHAWKNRLIKIRNKFAGTRTHKSESGIAFAVTPYSNFFWPCAEDSAVLSSYDLCKYVMKLSYMRVLGYSVHIGHEEVVSLMASPKIKEKATGYVAATLLIEAGEGPMQRIVSTVLLDLSQRGEKSYDARALALAYTSRMSLDLAKAQLGPYRARVADEAALLTCDRNAPMHARQKASLALARLAGTAKAGGVKFDAEPWFETTVDSLCANLQEAYQMRGVKTEGLHGIVMCSVRCLSAIAPQHPKWPDLVGLLLLDLEEQATSPTINKEVQTLYHWVFAPWLRLALVEALAQSPPGLSETVATGLGANARLVAQSWGVSDAPDHPSSRVARAKVRDSNGATAAAGINLAWLEFGARCDRLDASVRSLARRTVERATMHGDLNERLAAVRCLGRIARGGPFESVRAIVEAYLTDSDESCRQAALQLAIAGCEQAAAVDATILLLGRIAVSEPPFKESLARGVLQLAEKAGAHHNVTWLVETISRLAVEYSNHSNDDDELWREANIVLLRCGGVAAAATSLCRIIDQPLPGDAALKLAALVLTSRLDGGQNFDGLPPPTRLLDLLEIRFQTASTKCRILLLAVLDRLSTAAPECKDRVDSLLTRTAASTDPSLAQAAKNYKRKTFPYHTRTCSANNLPQGGLRVKRPTARSMPQLDLLSGLDVTNSSSAGAGPSLPPNPFQSTPIQANPFATTFADPFACNEDIPLVPRPASSDFHGEPLDQTRTAPSSKTASTSMSDFNGKPLDQTQTAPSSRAPSNSLSGFHGEPQDHTRTAPSYHTPGTSLIDAATLSRTTNPFDSSQLAPSFAPPMPEPQAAHTPVGVPPRAVNDRPGITEIFDMFDALAVAKQQQTPPP